MSHGARFHQAPPDEIQVSDLDLASYLIASGAKLAGVVPTVDPARRAFRIAGDPALLAEASQRFHEGAARVEPRSFAYARRFLRRALERP
ncbi:MAG: hypothetical protein ABSC46_03900 [Candidatus Limnocylindrales bacterium]|jgi:hypothetical protein